MRPRSGPRAGRVVWVEKKIPRDMFLGIPVEQVEDLHSRSGGNVLLVKTDGARKRLIKAPSETEPVIPMGATHCFLVLGLTAAGKPAGPDIVFRFERSLPHRGLFRGRDHCGQTHRRPRLPSRELPRAVSRPGRGGFSNLSHCTSPERVRLAEEIRAQIPEGCYDLCIAGDSIEGRFYLIGEKK